MSDQTTQVSLADDTEIPECIRPRLPHDQLSFEELSREYNFRNISNIAIPFTRLVIDICRSASGPTCALDIGCGGGIQREAKYHRAIRRHVADFQGVEPDCSVEIEDGLFDHVERALLDEADLPEEHFDLAYSIMVMEHVSNPEAFFRAVFRSLKPGGTYLFVTPNKRHYFTRTASFLHTLRIDEIVLRLAKGKKTKDEYHYPVVYRCNDEKRINALAASTGFEPPEYAYLEGTGIAGYFPGPTRILYHLMSMKRRVFKKPDALVTMFCRIAKPRNDAQ